MGFSRQEYWSGLPFPSPGDLRDPGIKPGSPALQAEYILFCRQNTYFSVFESFAISVCYFCNFIFNKGKTDLKSEVISHTELWRNGI